MLADIHTAVFPAIHTIEERADAQSTRMNTVYRDMHKKSRRAGLACRLNGTYQIHERRQTMRLTQTHLVPRFQLHRQPSARPKRASVFWRA